MVRGNEDNAEKDSGSGTDAAVIRCWRPLEPTMLATFRLADAVPQEAVERWRFVRDEWLRSRPEPWDENGEWEYHRNVFGSLNRWLDALRGECLLRSPAAASLLAESLHFGDGREYRQYGWVVMPNHVHVLFSVLGKTDPDWQVRQWKGIAARRIQRFLGGQRKIWEDGWHGRMIRSAGQFVWSARMIRQEPVKARLRPAEYILHECDELAALAY
jgi:hypothetical protein